MPRLSELPDHPLVGQCVVWCQAKRLKPIVPQDHGFLMLAIYDYDGDFAGLNQHQRRLIAGCA